MLHPIDVPVLPIPRVRALGILTESSPARDDLSTLVGLADLDPELTAAVIRAANSAASAPLDRIGNARAAITRLGASETQRVMLRVLVSLTFDLAKSGLDQDELWRHLVLCGVLAEGAIGRRSNPFTAGLLHDVGRMAMASQHPDAYSTVVDEVAAGRSPLDAERAGFGLSHVDWGVTITRGWELPETVVQAVAQHHRPSRRQLPVALFQARRVCQVLGWGDGLVAGTEAAGERTADSLAAAWAANLSEDEWAMPVLRQLGGMAGLLTRLGLSWKESAAA